MAKQDYKHVALKPDDFALLKGFSAGVDLTQGATVAALIRMQMKPGETAYAAGERLLNEWRQRGAEEAIPV